MRNFKFKPKKNSDYFKIVVASYFRFVSHYIYTCTEYEYMDVCACNSNYITEIECKISRSDLKKELLKDKHEYYSFSKKSKHVIVPNRYYIAIPFDMYDDETKDFINELNPLYGIMVVKDNEDYPIIVKEAKKLHNEKVSPKILEEIIRRMSSENISLRKKLVKLKESEQNLKDELCSYDKIKIDNKKSRK